MILEMPKNREGVSSLEIERMINPFKVEEESVFYSWDRYDYSYLEEARRKKKIKE